MEVTGVVENIVYRNSENGYTIIELFAEGRIITVAGKFPIIGKGETLETRRRV